MHYASAQPFILAELSEDIVCYIDMDAYTDGNPDNILLSNNIHSYPVVDEPSGEYQVWIGYDGDQELLHVLCLNPLGENQYSQGTVYLTDLPTELYAGFMGSVGDAGNASEISNWYFKNDMSLMVDAMADADYAQLTIIMEALEAAPVDAFYLPLEGQCTSAISWAVSNPDIVTEEGWVTAPSLEQGNRTITLTATITNGTAVRTTRPFTITVKVPDDEITSADFAWLTNAIILNGNDALENIVSNLSLPTSGPNGSDISWSSSNTVVLHWNGNVTRPSYTDGDQAVALTAYINKGGSTREKTFDISVKALGMTDEDYVQADYLWLTGAQLLNGNPDLNHVTTDILLPTSGQYGCTITWESDNEAVVNNEGKVTRPSYTNGDETVTLTASITRGLFTTTRPFTVTVTKLEKSAAEKLAADHAWLTETQLLNGNASLDNIMGNLSLPAVGPDGSTITWASANSAVVGSNGVVTRQSFTAGDQTVTLTATLVNGTSMTKAFTITVKALEQSDEEKTEADKQWLTEAQILNGNISLDNIVENLTLPVAGPNGSTISWSSADPAVADVTGTITRPAYTAGDKVTVLTATIRRGVSEAMQTFTVTVKKLNQSAQEKVEADTAWLTEAQILNGNSALDQITTDLTLPTCGENGSDIAWYSTYPNVVAADGKVTRPSFTAGSKTVTIRATITLDPGISAQKDFVLTVIPVDMNDQEATDLDYDWLNRYNVLALNPTANSVTQNLSLPVSAPFHSTITWVSDKPSVIADDGTVTRPENGEGHQSVNVTATVSRGAFINQKTYTYVVLQKPDTTAPQVLSTIPANNSTQVSWDTKAILVNFNEKIVRGETAADRTFGIKLQAADIVPIGVTIEDNTLVISPYGMLTPGEHKLTIPAGTVADNAGNPAQACEFTFSVESWPVTKIAVVSTTPQDLEKEAEILGTKEIQVRFDNADGLKLGGIFPILKDKNRDYILFTAVSLQVDTIRVTANEIYPCCVIAIPAKHRVHSDSSLWDG